MSDDDDARSPPGTYRADRAYINRGAASPEGEALLTDVFELIQRRLPTLAGDDPARARLRPVLHELAAALERSPLLVVRLSQHLEDHDRRPGARD